VAEGVPFDETVVNSGVTEGLPLDETDVGLNVSKGVTFDGTDDDSCVTEEVPPAEIEVDMRAIIRYMSSNDLLLTLLTVAMNDVCVKTERKCSGTGLETNSV
jgi:hypothetical protein